MAMLEVFKPALQSAVNIIHNLSQASAVATPGFGSDGIFELLQAFLARPSSALHKVVAEEVKSLPGNAYVNQSGLDRVQSRKTERYIGRKIRSLVLTRDEYDEMKPKLRSRPHLLLWEKAQPDSSDGE